MHRYNNLVKAMNAARDGGALYVGHFDKARNKWGGAVFSQHPHVGVSQVDIDRWPIREPAAGTR